MRNILALVITICCFGSNFAQVNKDSLYTIYKDKSISDSLRLKAISDLAWDGYLLTDADSAIYFAKLYYKLSEEKKFPKGKAEAFNTIGVAFYYQGKFDSARVYFQKCFDINLIIENINGQASCLNNLGNVFMEKGDFMNSVQHITGALQLYEKLGDSIGMSDAITNIGLIYGYQESHEKAIESYLKSLEISLILKDDYGIQSCYNNLGTSYSALNLHEKAKENFQKSLEMATAGSDLYNQAIAIHNIGKSYIALGNLDSATFYTEKSLILRKELGDLKGLASSLCSLGEIQMKKQLIPQSIKTYEEALKLGQEIGEITSIQFASNGLYLLFKKTGKIDKALEMHELYIEIRDSIQSEESKNAVFQQRMEYDYNKKNIADSVKLMESKKLSEAEIETEKAKNRQHKVEAEQQQQKAYFLYGGLVLTLLFGGFIFNRFRVTNKQKNIIHDQKLKVDEAYHELEEKNTEILDSINYARRIQKAILPPDRIVKEYLKESFIIYKPKDVVAGDFYWMEHVDNTVLFAAADCTGHGVPGAMVSVICNNGLNRSVREHGLKDPGEILNKTREIVIQEFEKSDEEVKDGMDISLCQLDFSSNKLLWAGANNPLWIIRANEILEFKADKQPIGKYSDPKPFTTHEISLEAGDAIYIFSDGYIDQFGGPKGKKFMSSRFKKLLLSIQEESMSQQQVIIENTFEEWCVHEEQIDDVCVIGVKF